MAKRDTSSPSRSGLASLTRWLKSGRTWAWLTRPWVKWAIVLVIVFTLGWLVYRNIVSVLLGGVPLPPGVREEPVEIDTQLLERVNSGRLERVQYSPIPFDTVSRSTFGI